MRTLFPGYEGPVDVTEEMIGRYFTDLANYCKDYREQILTFCTDLFSKGHHRHYPNHIYDDVERVFSDKSLFNGALSLQQTDGLDPGYLSTFLARSKRLIIPRKIAFVNTQTDGFATLRQQISPSKAQQVALFYNMLKENLGSRISSYTYLDFGAGRGYLTALLSQDVGLRCVAIEASQKHAASMCLRMRHLGIHHPENLYFCIRTITCDAGVGQIEQNATGFKEFLATYATQSAHNKQHITEHRFRSHIQGVAAPDLQGCDLQKTSHTGQQYVACGLHACGNLSVLILKLFLTQESICSTFTVPCCYQHLGQESLPLNQEMASILRILESDQYTVSENFQDYKIPLQILNYACTGFDEDLNKALRTVNQFYNRAVFEACMNIAGLTQKVCVQERRSIETNEQLVSWIYDVLNNQQWCPAKGYDSVDQLFRAPPRRLAKREIEEQIAVTAGLKWKMKCHYLFRQVAGQVFESALLVDRLVYLRRNGVQRSRIQYCMGQCSSRGFAIYGQKNDTARHPTDALPDSWACSGEAGRVSQAKNRRYRQQSYE